MNSEQLKKAEKDLLNRERAFEGKRAEVEALLISTNAQLDVLVPRVKKSRAELEQVQAKLDDEAKRYQELINKNQRLELEAADSQKHIAALTASISDLDEVIAAKKTSIDDETAEYAKQQRTEVINSLADLEAKKTSLTNDINQLDNNMETKQKERDTLRTVAAQERSDFEVEKKSLEDELRDLRAKRPELAATVDQLQREVTRSQLELEHVAAETNKAKVQFDNYLKYEDRSRKLLQTKDEELQERAAEIDQSSRHLKAQRSFLPPM